MKLFAKSAPYRVFVLALFLICLLGNTSCSHYEKTRKKCIPDATDSAAVLGLVHASYLKGCVDAHHTLGKKNIFFQCGEKASAHMDEIRGIIE